MDLQIDGVKEGELSGETSKIINAQFLNRITREYIDDQITIDEAVKKINANYQNSSKFIS